MLQHVICHDNVADKQGSMSHGVLHTSEPVAALLHCRVQTTGRWRCCRGATCAPGAAARGGSRSQQLLPLARGAVRQNASTFLGKGPRPHLRLAAAPTQAVLPQGRCKSREAPLGKMQTAVGLAPVLLCSCTSRQALR